MTVQYNRLPTYDQPLVTKGATTRGYYTALTGILAGQPTGPEVPNVVATSPETLTAPSGGTYIVQGGTTSKIELSRDGLTFYVLGVTSGPVPVSKGDQVRLTFTVAPPTVTFFPI
jgi:hypothetical protein